MLKPKSALVVVPRLSSRTTVTNDRRPTGQRKRTDEDQQPMLIWAITLQLIVSTRAELPPGTRRMVASIKRLGVNE